MLCFVAFGHKHGRKKGLFELKKCTASRLKRQFDKWHLFRAPTPPFFYFGRGEKAHPPPHFQAYLETLTSLHKESRPFSQIFVLTKDPQPLYNKTPPCLFYHKSAIRKAILAP